MTTQIIFVVDVNVEGIFADGNDNQEDGHNLWQEMASEALFVS